MREALLELAINTTMIKALDSVRFYAFLAVFFFHCDYFHFEAGYIGVIAFFVLSGFLLTPILVDMKSSMPFKRYMISFYGRRMLRIFPLYYLYLLVAGLIAGVAIFVFNSNRTSVVRLYEQLPYVMTYTYDFYHASALFKHSLFTHFWSLAVEEQFYLVWPLFVWFCRTDKLKPYLFLIILAGPLIRYVTYAACGWFGSSWLYHDPLVVVYVLPLSHFDAFATGGLLALMPRLEWKHAAWTMTVVALMLGIVSQYIVSGDILWGDLGYPPLMNGAWKLVWGYSVLNITFGCILRAVKSNAFIRPLFSAPVIQYLGKISYGLYVYHFPIVWFISFKYKSSKMLDKIGLTALMFVATVGLAALSYELFEKKFIAMKDALFSKDISSEKHEDINAVRSDKQI
ncbi:MAG: acyltransferase family protein [Desulfatirhabdiaceae bacterium]